MRRAFPSERRSLMLAPEGDETFELSSEEEAKLHAAIAEAERGDTTSAVDLLKQIRRL